MPMPAIIPKTPVDRGRSLGEAPSGRWSVLELGRPLAAQPSVPQSAVDLASFRAEQGGLRPQIECIGPPTLTAWRAGFAERQHHINLEKFNDWN